jgi:hypothetical protein
VGSGFLVVELKVDTRDAEGWQEEVLYSEGRYELYTDYKSWSGAEAHCQAEGGHLASILTAEEHREAAKVAGRDSVWLGGTDEDLEGTWRWTDGSAWAYTGWEAGHGSSGKKYNYIKMHGRPPSSWSDMDEDKLHFLCRIRPRTVKGKKTITLEYNKTQITFQSLHVWHRYQAASQELVDSWRPEDRSMTGFRLRWFLRSSNGTKLTEKKADVRAEDWRPEEVPARFRDPFLRSMVAVAREAREKNIAAEILEKALRVETSTKLRDRYNYNYTGCSDGQQVIYNADKYGKMEYELLDETSEQPVSEADIILGYKIFSALLTCPQNLERANLYFFLQYLLTHTSRTIIKATVTSIQASDIQDTVNKNLVNKFYSSLDKIFNLQYGKILLATSSPNELQNQVDNNWPFFSHYSKEVEQCLSGASCQEVRDAILALGKTPASKHEYIPQET